MDQDVYVSEWAAILNNATDSDSWGQVVEAGEMYEKYVPTAGVETSLHLNPWKRIYHCFLYTGLHLYDVLLFIGWINLSAHL